MDQKKAKNVYLWLWFSPFLTIPTLAMVLFLDPGFIIFCSDTYRHCNWGIAERATAVIAVVLSSLWHLGFLKSALNSKNAFVRWHGRQGLALASLRTAIPLFFALLFGFAEIISFLFIPILISVWFFGTLLGQNQVKRGNCSLASWLGHADELAKSIEISEPLSSEEELESLIRIIRFSQDQKARNNAFIKLEKIGVVEDL